MGAAGQVLAEASTDREGDGDGDFEGDGLGDFDGLGELEGVAVGLGESEPDKVANGDAITGSDGDGSADSRSEDADELGGAAAGDSTGDCASRLLVDSAEMTAARAVRASTGGDASTARSSEPSVEDDSSVALGSETESSRAVDDADGLGDVDVGDGEMIDDGRGELFTDGDGDEDGEAVGDGRVLIDASHSGGNPSVDNASFVERVDEVLESVTEPAAFAGGAPSKEIETAKQAITEAPMRMRALASNRPKTPARPRRPIACFSCSTKGIPPSR